MKTTFFRIVARVALAILFGVGPVVRANPEPDIPVHVSFENADTCTIRIEVDPRCFTDDPMSERYLMKVDLTHRNAAELQALQDQVAEALPRWVKIEFDPAAALKPVYAFAFTGENQKPLVKADDPVVVSAEWKFACPTKMKALRVLALKGGHYSVVVRYDLRGVEQERFATLFPGEASFWIKSPSVAR